MNEEYLKGLQDVEDFIFHAIQRNGGGRTNAQLASVLEDLNHFLHRNIHNAPQQP